MKTPSTPKSLILNVAGPYPARKAAHLLQERLVTAMVHQRPAVGTPLPPDTELARRTGLSYATIFRAMRELQAAGWIERRVGEGTFVGPRAALPFAPQRHAVGQGTHLLRVGVLMFLPGQRDVFSTGIIEGLEDAALDQTLAIELISDPESNIERAAQRLAQSRPDALVAVHLRLQSLRVLVEAARLGIPTVLAGSRFPELGLTNIYEDSRQGMRLAVEHLAQQGHRRIGLLLEEGPNWYRFDRRAGYLDGLRATGIHADENLVLWVPFGDRPNDYAPEVAAYLQTQRPTAVIASLERLVEPLTTATRLLGWRIPDDLSLVVFDQSLRTEDWVGCPVTHVAQPLEEIGRQAAEAVRHLVEQKPVETSLALPCKLVTGTSTAKPTPALSSPTRSIPIVDAEV